MSIKPRVAVLGIFLESNAFCEPFMFDPIKGSMYMSGEQITRDARSPHPRIVKEIIGFYRRMDYLDNWEPVPIIFAGAKAAGSADQTRVTEIIGEIVAGLKAAGPLDAVYIANHGAMTATQDQDIEGEMVASVRATVGNIPIVGTLDLHGNVSDRMVDSVDLYVAYRTDPHVDQFERGVEAADGLSEILSGTRTALANICVPIVAPNVSLQTDDGPYGDLIALGQQMMDDSILNISILAGFAFSDTDKNGLHIIVTSRGDADKASAVAKQLATSAWDDRRRFDWDLTSQEDAVRMAVDVGNDPAQLPLFLVDLGDNAGAGGPANNLSMLAALHQAGAKDALIGNLYDPKLVDQAYDTGVGNRFVARFAGDNWEGAPASYEADAVVIALHDAPCIGRAGINAGRTLYSGRSCLLRVGSILVTANSIPTTLNDPAYVEMLGIRPGSFRSLVLKGRGSTYLVSWGDYFPAGREKVLVDTLGRTSPVLTRHDWQNLPRPSWPLDREFDWDTPAPKVRMGAGSTGRL